MMDDKKCIENLNMGIACKRKGDYKKALEYYIEAKKCNPENMNVYYNIGKISCGAGNHAVALKCYITYAHLLTLNINLLNNMANQIEIQKNQEILNGIDLSLPIGYSFPQTSKNNVTKDEGLLLLLSDNNLLFYSGLAYIANNSILMEHYNINSNQLEDIKAGLLSKPTEMFLRSKEYEGILIAYGFMVLMENIESRISKNDVVVGYYFSNTFMIKDPIICDIF